ncbi:hypothetical protein KIPB_004614 [Kipferlia bialata]|uniref:Uncharacterized protein n=1 Tax=Kipferlia bialata TaxID=797122 RepID=A0A391P247_9EUKA|nr:hypothetical protein KIPB_004614 [Kipferlia bialata]|eukprot:g4614.t1
MSARRGGTGYLSLDSPSGFVGSGEFDLGAPIEERERDRERETGGYLVSDSESGVSGCEYTESVDADYEIGIGEAIEEITDWFNDCLPDQIHMDNGHDVPATDTTDKVYGCLSGRPGSIAADSWRPGRVLVGRHAATVCYISTVCHMLLGIPNSRGEYPLPCIEGVSGTGKTAFGRQSLFKVIADRQVVQEVVAHLSTILVSTHGSVCEGDATQAAQDLVFCLQHILLSGRFIATGCMYTQGMHAVAGVGDAICTHFGSPPAPAHVGSFIVRDSVERAVRAYHCEPEPLILLEQWRTHPMVCIQYTDDELETDKASRLHDGDTDIPKYLEGSEVSHYQVAEAISSIPAAVKEALEELLPEKKSQSLESAMFGVPCRFSDAVALAALRDARSLLGLCPAPDPCFPAIVFVDYIPPTALRHTIQFMRWCSGACLFCTSIDGPLHETAAVAQICQMELIPLRLGAITAMAAAERFLDIRHHQTDYGPYTVDGFRCEVTDAEERKRAICTLLSSGGSPLAMKRVIAEYRRWKESERDTHTRDTHGWWMQSAVHDTYRYNSVLEAISMCGIPLVAPGSEYDGDTLTILHPKRPGVTVAHLETRVLMTPYVVPSCFCPQRYLQHRPTPSPSPMHTLCVMVPPRLSFLQLRSVRESEMDIDTMQHPWAEGRDGTVSVVLSKLYHNIMAEAVGVYVSKSSHTTIFDTLLRYCLVTVWMERARCALGYVSGTHSPEDLVPLWRVFGLPKIHLQGQGCAMVGTTQHSQRETQGGPRGDPYDGVYRTCSGLTDGLVFPGLSRVTLPVPGRETIHAHSMHVLRDCYCSATLQPDAPRISADQLPLGFSLNPSTAGCICPSIIFKDEHGLVVVTSNHTTCLVHQYLVCALTETLPTLILSVSTENDRGKCLSQSDRDWISIFSLQERHKVIVQFVAQRKREGTWSEEMCNGIMAAVTTESEGAPEPKLDMLSIPQVVLGAEAYGPVIAGLVGTSTHSKSEGEGERDDTERRPEGGMC